MHILVIVAGTNDPSNSHTLANTFAQGTQKLPETHVHTRLLRNLHIEHFTVEFYEPNCTQEEDFCELRERMEEASGVVIASPVWNFGVPAHLKNLIDRMGSFALDESRSKGTLNGKPFYFILTGGAPTPAWTGLMKKTASFLQEGIRYFGGSIIGTHYEPKCTKGKGKFGLVVDERPESLASMREKGLEFAKVCSEYEKTGKAPAKQRAIKRFYNWGQSVMNRL
jgi:multimeric flavodoxin WrbA